MKFTNAITLLLMIAVMSVQAQAGRRDKVNALKTAFITDELSLTKAEAEKFWPVYNAYESKQFQLRNGVLRTVRQQTDAGTSQLSDKEALLLLQQLDDAEDGLHNNRKKLLSDLRKVISPVKILKLKKAEEDFNRRLLRQYRDKGRQRR